MSEEREREEDPLVDLWLANWEQQCAEHLESEPDCEGQLQADRDRAIHNNWLLFQNTATAIAQLYKGTLSVFILLYMRASCRLVLVIAFNVPPLHVDYY